MLFLVPLLIMVIAVCGSIARMVQNFVCQDCPLKEQCKKASENGEPLPCQDNIHSSLFSNDPFHSGL
jgi:hypothetical protein